jgi:hypothetical protein
LRRPSNSDRFTSKAGIIEFLYGRIKTIHIHVDNFLLEKFLWYFDWLE